MHNRPLSIDPPAFFLTALVQHIASPLVSLSLSNHLMDQAKNLLEVDDMHALPVFVLLAAVAFLIYFILGKGDELKPKILAALALYTMLLNNWFSYVGAFLSDLNNWRVEYYFLPNVLLYFAIAIYVSISKNKVLYAVMGIALIRSLIRIL